MPQIPLGRQQLTPKSPTLPPNSLQAWCMHINLHIHLTSFIQI
jgi:hypothetical protein